LDSRYYTVKHCQYIFGFDLPSVMLETRRDKYLLSFALRAAI